MLRSRMGELWRRFIQGRQICGVDEHLNKYYMCALMHLMHRMLIGALCEHGVLLTIRTPVAVCFHMASVVVCLVADAAWLACDVY